MSSLGKYLVTPELKHYAKIAKEYGMTLEEIINIIKEVFETEVKNEQRTSKT